MAAKPPIHAIVRAAERYGIKLTPVELRAAADSCRKDGILIARQTDGHTIWLHKIKGSVCQIVLSKEDNIVTFLPPLAKLATGRMRR